MSFMPIATAPVSGIELIGTTSNTAAAATKTIGASDITGVSNGDLLILAAASDLSTSPSTPSGWSVAFNDNAFDGTSLAAIFYKTATSSDVSVSVGTLATESLICMMAISGADWDSYTNSSSDTLTAPTHTVPSGGCAVVVGFGQDQGSAMALPTGYTGINAVSSLIQTSLSIGINVDSGDGSVSPGSFSSFTSTNMMRITTIGIS